MDTAALLPEAMALITYVGPVVKSPPAKIPGILVDKVFSSTTSVPHKALSN